MDDRSSVYFRAAERSDARALARLRCSSLLEMELLAPNAADGFEREALAEFVALFDDERLTAWVLVAGGRVVGSACVVFWRRLPYGEGSLHAELCGVYVEPALRRRGFARELCARALTSARARNARRIVVHASDEGRPLYEQLGFCAGNQMRFDAAALVTSAAGDARSREPSLRSSRAPSS